MSFAIAVTVATAFVSALFVYIGLNFKGDKLFNQVLKIFFVIMGLIFASATMGLAVTIASEGGAGTNTQNLVEIMTAYSSYGVYIFMFIIMLSTLIGIITWLVKRAKKPKGA